MQKNYPTHCLTCILQHLTPTTRGPQVSPQSAVSDPLPRPTYTCSQRTSSAASSAPQGRQAARFPQHRWNWTGGLGSCCDRRPPVIQHGAGCRRTMLQGPTVRRPVVEVIYLEGLTEGLSVPTEGLIHLLFSDVGVD